MVKERFLSWIHRERAEVLPATTPLELALSKCIQKGSSVMVNIGCGRRWHPDWINIDVNGDDISVYKFDLRKAIPFPPHSVDFIYLSHCLEHFDRTEAKVFLESCHSVLKPGGIIRIVVPDLENIARVYLESLEHARRNPDNKKAVAVHEWMIIELIDQLCRHQPGGEMLRVWVAPEVEAEEHIISRVGDEYVNTRANMSGLNVTPLQNDAETVGSFRLSGEPHLWMYDSVSLERTLCGCGFMDVREMSVDESNFEQFSIYRLDANDKQAPHKPDSLYMEGRKAVP